MYTKEIFLLLTLVCVFNTYKCEETKAADDLEPEDSAHVFNFHNSDVHVGRRLTLGNKNLTEAPSQVRVKRDDITFDGSPVEGDHVNIGGKQKNKKKKKPKQ